MLSRAVFRELRRNFAQEKVEKKKQQQQPTTTTHTKLKQSKREKSSGNKKRLIARRSFSFSFPLSWSVFKELLLLLLLLPHFFPAFSGRPALALELKERKKVVEIIPRDTRSKQQEMEKKGFLFAVGCQDKLPLATGLKIPLFFEMRAAFGRLAK